MRTEFSMRAILAGRAPQDAPVTIRGWVRTRRDSKAGISFIHLSDGSSFHPVQVVAPSTLPNYTDEVLRLTAGCAVEATGKIVPSPAKGQPFEMQASAIRVIGWVEDPDHYPIQPKPHSLEFLREVAHLRPRTNVIAAATRVRHSVAQAIHRFFSEQGFFWVNTPIITAADAEGAGALFRVSTLDFANLPRAPDGKVDFAKDFFGRETFLTVSGQLNVEAYCLALTKVYTFGPTFRAENSNTSRHLAEFWMIEPEIAFADLAADADLAEALMKYVFKALLDERGEEFTKTRRREAYRDSFVKSYSSTIGARLADLRRKAKEYVADEDKFALALRSTKERVDEEFYRLFPEYDPDVRRKMQEAADFELACAFAALPQDEQERLIKQEAERIKRENAAWERSAKRAKGNYRRVREYDDYEPTAWARGASVANRVNLNNDGEVKEDKKGELN